MVYCAQAELGFSSVARRDAVFSDLQAWLAGKPRWGEDTVFAVSEVLVARQPLGRGIIVTVRFVSQHLSFGQGPDTSRTTQNVRVIGAHVDGIEVRAAKNIEVRDFEGGPVIICAATGSQFATAQKCDPNGPEFEAQFAGRCCPFGAGGGNVDWEGTQIPKVSNNLGGYHPVNVRFENGWVHDLQTKDADLWHTGCGILQFFRGAGTGGDAGGSHNVVLDRIVCERATVQGFFIEDADGITIQNSVSSCPTEPYNQARPIGRWGQCVITQRGIDIKSGTSGWTPTNILWRYNAVEARANSTYSNVRVIGNIYRDESACDASKSGVTWTRNVAYGSNSGFLCGTNSLHVGSTAPWEDTDYGDVPSTSTLINFRLTAGTKPFENWISETAPDYSVAVDASGTLRRTPRTAGPHQR